MMWRMGNERQETNKRREAEGSRVQCLQNQSEGHGERLIFPFLICQSPAAWRLGGPGEEGMGQEWSKSWRPRPGAAGGDGLGGAGPHPLSGGPGWVDKVRKMRLGLPSLWDPVVLKLCQGPSPPENQRYLLLAPAG